MGVLGSRLDPGSDAYRANRAANLDLLVELDRLLAQARAGGGQKYVDRHSMAIATTATTHLTTRNQSG